MRAQWGKFKEQLQVWTYACIYYKQTTIKTLFIIMSFAIEMFNFQTWVLKSVYAICIQAMKSSRIQWRITHCLKKFFLFVSWINPVSNVWIWNTHTFTSILFAIVRTHPEERIVSPHNNITHDTTESRRNITPLRANERLDNATSKRSCVTCYPAKNSQKPWRL